MLKTLFSGVSVGIVELTGQGGLEYSGRWHTAGHAVVYLADSSTGALIETLVHLEIEEQDVPPDFRLMQIRAASGTSIVTVNPAQSGWQEDLKITRSIGDAWLESVDSALLKVPSVLAPKAYNYLLNPLHADAAYVTVEETVEGRYDARLFRQKYMR